mmetsp:Transcript_30275/g.44764  ORF Transcript_30275/g.44764 Transcript_30275/m.44764 type:complete len:237 (+) Transcript_30275:427-1137(+)
MSLLIFVFASFDGQSYTSIAHLLFQCFEFGNYNIIKRPTIHQMTTKLLYLINCIFNHSDARIRRGTVVHGGTTTASMPTTSSTAGRSIPSSNEPFIFDHNFMHQFHLQIHFGLNFISNAGKGLLRHGNSVLVFFVRVDIIWIDVHNLRLDVIVLDFFSQHIQCNIAIMTEFEQVHEKTREVGCIDCRVLWGGTAAAIAAATRKQPIKLRLLKLQQFVLGIRIQNFQSPQQDAVPLL